MRVNPGCSLRGMSEGIMGRRRMGSAPLMWAPRSLQLFRLRDGNISLPGELLCSTQRTDTFRFWGSRPEFKAPPHLPPYWGLSTFTPIIINNSNLCGNWQEESYSTSLQCESTLFLTFHNNFNRHHNEILFYNSFFHQITNVEVRIETVVNVHCP